MVVVGLNFEEPIEFMEFEVVIEREAGDRRLDVVELYLVADLPLVDGVRAVIIVDDHMLHQLGNDAQQSVAREQGVLVEVHVRYHNLLRLLVHLHDVERIAQRRHAAHLLKFVDVLVLGRKFWLKWFFVKRLFH